MFWVARQRCHLASRTAFQLQKLVEIATLGVYWSVCLQRSVCFEAVLQVFEDIAHKQIVMS